MKKLFLMIKFDNQVVISFNTITKACGKKEQGKILRKIDGKNPLTMLLEKNPRLPSHIDYTFRVKTKRKLRKVIFDETIINTF